MVVRTIFSWRPPVADANPALQARRWLKLLIVATRFHLVACGKLKTCRHEGRGLR